MCFAFLTFSSLYSCFTFLVLSYNASMAEITSSEVDQVRRDKRADGKHIPVMYESGIVEQPNERSITHKDVASSEWQDTLSGKANPPLMSYTTDSDRADASVHQTKQTSCPQEAVLDLFRELINSCILSKTHKEPQQLIKQQIKAINWAELSQERRLQVLKRYPNLAEIWRDTAEPFLEGASVKSVKNVDVRKEQAYIAEEMMQQMAAGKLARHEFELYYVRKKEYDDFDAADKQYVWLDWLRMTDEQRAEHDEDR